MTNSHLPPRRKPYAAVAIVAGLLAFGIYYLRSGDAAQHGQGGAPQAMPVAVKTLKSEKIRIWAEFSGRLRAVDAVEIRPEVSGKITQVRFEDGQKVKAGDVLLVIDPRPYEAAAAKAEAELATAQTNADFARKEEKRAAGMVKSQAIAERLYDERVSARRSTEAAVKSAQANLQQARLNLEYANVRAPISGRVGRTEITKGNLVQAGAGAPLLTTIVSDKEIYADFEVDEQTYLQNIHAYADGADKERAIPVEMKLHSNEDRIYKGTIYSFDNRLNTNSGTIRARAKFANEKGALVPGMFISVRLAGGGEQTLVTVPETAVGTDQNKRFVYVADENNKVSYREISLGKTQGSDRIVLGGLKEGDRVITGGLQYLRPDMPVIPNEAGVETTANSK